MWKSLICWSSSLFLLEILFQVMSEELQLFVSYSMPSPCSAHVMTAELFIENECLPLSNNADFSDSNTGCTWVGYQEYINVHQIILSNKC